MLINIEDFMKFDEEKAFDALLKEMFEDCSGRFSNMTGHKKEWHIQQPTTEDAIFEGIEKNAERIIKEEYNLIDIIDLINCATMLYNFKAQKPKVITYLKENKS